MLTPRIRPLILAFFIYPVIASFWVFVLWMLWIIAKSLKGMDESLNDIARNLQKKD
jgi:fructose-specific phosphotransferase system IIC component